MLLLKILAIIILAFFIILNYCFIKLIGFDIPSTVYATK